MAAARWCAVTGGRGCMARYLVAALLGSGEWHVRVTDLAPTIVLGSGEEEAILGAALQDGRAAYMSVDVCNLTQISRAFEGVEVVFHTAAPDPLNNNTKLHYKVNVEGTRNVIEACISCKVKRLIHTSSGGVVFDGVHSLIDVDESTPYPAKFIDCYTETKAEGEKLVMKANGTNGLLTCCIRPGAIFGPTDRTIPGFLRTMIGKFTITPGDGTNYEDFVYVENVAYGHICAEKALSTEEGAKTVGGQAYFITNMEPVNLWDFVSLALDNLGYKRQLRINVPAYVLTPMAYVVNWVYAKVLRFQASQTLVLTPALVKYMILSRTFSCKKAQEQLGYTPIVSLKDGLRKALELHHDFHAQIPSQK